MKTVLMIGKLNDMMKDLNSYLKMFFRVQLCADDVPTALGMIKVVEPDIIVISLIGMFDVSAGLFARIKAGHSRVPVITIGTQSEREALLSYYEDDQFRNITRPTTNEEIFEAICKRLVLDKKKLVKQHQEAQDDRKKVLVVDDNATTLRSIKGMLDKKYKVILATSGMQALASIGKQRPDVILLDYEMPVCDGRQTFEMIKADEDMRDIPVIFLTSVNDRENIQAVLKLMPAGYLLKPPVTQRLIDTIEKAVSGE